MRIFVEMFLAFRDLEKVMPGAAGICSADAFVIVMIGVEPRTVLAR